jgi:hypothetical protein
VDITAYIPPTVPATATYQAVGNATLQIGAAIGLLQTAFSINGNGVNGTGATLAVTTLTPAGSQSGAATIAADGSFTYLSSPTYVSAGAATEDFAYTVTDGIAATTTDATMQINVPEHVWYVRPSFVGVSVGSNSQPFKDFSGVAGAGVQSVAVASDTILVMTGSGNAAAGTLKNSQVVYGQGASVAKTFATGSAATYRNGGTAITILATGVSPHVDALTLGVTNTLRGLTLGNNTTTALVGTSFGTLTVTETTINAGASAAINLNTGTLSGSFSSVTSAGGAQNIRLQNVGTLGAVDFGTGQLSGASSDGFSNSGGAGTFSYAGNITNSANTTVNITSMSGGAVSLSGNLNSFASLGRGVAIAGNTGGTITLSGAEMGFNSTVNLSANTGATINFTPSTGMHISLNGTGFSASVGGTLSLTGGDNIVNSSTGRAVFLSNVTIAAAGFTFASTTGSNVALTSVAGPGIVALGTGALSLAALNAVSFLVNGGSATVSYDGSISKNLAGQLVSIASRAGNVTLSGNLACIATCGSTNGAISVFSVTGGTITFSGQVKTITIPSSSVGVNLTNNTGAFIDFTNGGLAVQTASGPAFNATTGGTVSVRAGTNDNTLQTTSGGMAFRLLNTTISASNTTFRLISSVGATNGISLTNTGASGGLIVTGSGLAGSGGVIAGVASGADGAAAGNGVYLNNANNVSLNWMTIGSSQNNGIYATGVRGLALDHVVFSGSQGNNSSATFEESAIHLVDVGGTVSITNSTIGDVSGAFSNVRVVNTVGSPALDSLVFASNTLGSMQASGTESVALQFAAGATDVRMRNNQMTWWGTNGIHVVVQNTATGTVVVTGNTLSQSNGAPVAGASGIVVDGGNVQYGISGNSVQGATGAAIAVNESSTLASVFHGTINNNTIGAAGTANSGSSAGAAISLTHLGAGTGTHAVTNNIIRQINGTDAIIMQGGDASGSGGNGTMNVTITGNDIQEEGNTINAARQAITLNAGTVAGDGHAFCVDIGGVGALLNNIVNYNASSVGNDNRILLNEVFATTVRLPGYAGANNDVAAVAAYLLGRNTASRATALDNVSAGGFGFLDTTPPSSGCPQP